MEATVQQLEQAILEGQDVDAADLAAARVREESERRVQELQAERVRRIAKEETVSARYKELCGLKQKFESLRIEVPNRLKSKRVAINKAIVDYLHEVSAVNSEFEFIADAFRQERANPTDGLNLPFQHDADEYSLTIGGAAMRAAEWEDGLRRVVALSIRSQFPNYVGDMSGLYRADEEI